MRKCLDEVARDATLKQTYAEMFNTYQTVEKDGKIVFADTV